MMTYEDYREDEDARFWFIEGECDAIALKSPAHRDNHFYMLGYRDAKYELSLGRICWRWTDENEFKPVGEEEF